MPASEHSGEGPIYSELAQRDKDFVEIVQLFVHGLVARLESVQEALSNNDFDRLHRLAHQLKGSGAGHGYTVLTEKAADIEQQAIKGQIDHIRTGLTELQAVTARIKVLP